MSAQASNGRTGSRRRIPDFFIVGHHKSGTTALYEMLRRHPQVYMPDLKEPRYLQDELTPRFHQPRDIVRPDTLDGYLSLFDPAAPDQLAGEASATYLWSPTAARRIAELQPAARIIAILREPVSFLHSLHLTYLRGQVESKKDLAAALALEGARREGRRIPGRSHLPELLLYSDHVRYVEQLQRYHESFPPEQILVLIYDDFRSDNLGTMQRVLRFLEVEETVPVEQVEVNVTSRALRSPQAEDALYAMAMGEKPLARPANMVAKALIPRRIRRAAFTAARQRLVFRSVKAPDQELARSLRQRFRPEVAAVSEYLERDLIKLWGYDLDEPG